MAIVATVLCSCGDLGGNSPASLSLPTISVRNWSGLFHQEGFPSSGWHSFSGISVNTQMVGLAPRRIVVSQYPDALNGWHQSVDVINPLNGSDKLLLRLPVEHEAAALAMNAKWFIYEDALASNGTYRSLVARNFMTGRSHTIFKLPLGTFSAGAVSGLTIHDGTAFWLANLVTPEGLIGRVYSFDLATGRLRIRLSTSDTTQHRLFLAMSSSARGLWISVAQPSKNPQGPGGALWYWSYRAKIVTRHIPVWHPPTLLYGADATVVLFSSNPQRPPSSLANPGPYPVYALDFGSKRMDQLTNAVNPGGSASLYQSWVAVNSVQDGSVLLNLNTRTRYMFAWPQAAVGGGWLVLRSADGLLWHTLPRAAMLAPGHPATR